MARGLLRNRRGGHAEVSNLELFFDLVYVFAITQVAQFVREHPGLLGLVEAALLFLAVWWAWICTAWATNWANPDTVPVRLMMLGAMLASLVLAATLPRAFDGDHYARVFVLSYCAIQVGRTLFVMWITAQDRPAIGDPGDRRRLVWPTVSAAVRRAVRWHTGSGRPVGMGIIPWRLARTFRQMGFARQLANHSIQAPCACAVARMTSASPPGQYRTLNSCRNVVRLVSSRTHARRRDPVASAPAASIAAVIATRVALGRYCQTIE